jgi:hypothetical protein
MGYNTWNDLRCAGNNETAILNVFDVWAAQGMWALGFRFVNLDDCWQSMERASDGELIVSLRCCLFGGRGKMKRITTENHVCEVKGCADS